MISKQLFVVYQSSWVVSRVDDSAPENHPADMSACDSGNALVYGPNHVEIKHSGGGLTKQLVPANGTDLLCVYKEHA